MKVTLRDGSQTRSFQFVEPSRDKWNKQNCEFLRGVKTGLPAPFERVFVKRVWGRVVTGHNLLLTLTGKTLPASPRFFGCYQNGERYLYFFQNLPISFVTLEEELSNINVVAPALVRRIVGKAAEIFKVIEGNRHVYIDFCAKNIMLERDTGSIAIIDIDSAWPQEWLRVKKPTIEGQIQFWGLWNETVSKVVPVRLENAQKSVLLSFAAVWSRAIALKRRGTKRDFHSALTLVHSPSFDRQRPLWEALACAKKQGFLEYFQLGTARGAAVYAQWQAVFNALLRGRELPWAEIVSATDNLLAAIGEADTPAVKRLGKRFSAPAVRRSSKDRLSRLGIIALAEAEDIKALIADRK